MENINTIKESLIYSTLYMYVQGVPQNIYHHKSFSSFWFPDIRSLIQMNT